MIRAASVRIGRPPLESADSFSLIFHNFFNYFGSKFGFRSLTRFYLIFNTNPYENLLFKSRAGILVFKPPRIRKLKSRSLATFEPSKKNRNYDLGSRAGGNDDISII